jgi:hypothetical protein
MWLKVTDKLIVDGNAYRAFTVRQINLLEKAEVKRCFRRKVPAVYSKFYQVVGSPLEDSKQEAVVLLSRLSEEEAVSVMNTLVEQLMNKEKERYS